MLDDTRIQREHVSKHRFKKRNKPAHHDLEPPSRRDGLERREAARGNIGELQVLRHRQVAREADAGLNGDDVEEPEHRSPSVLDFHDLVPAHVARLDKAKRVVDAERGEHANVTRVLILKICALQKHFVPSQFNGTAIPDSVMLIRFEMKMFTYDDRSDDDTT